MSTNFELRALGVLLAAAMALLAVASVAVASSEFEAEELPATVSGTYTGWGLVTEGGEVTCSVSLSATLSEASSTLTLTPSFSSCKAFGFAEATVKPEGCKLVLHGGSETAEAETYAATTDVSCEAGKSIKITASTCAIEVGAQTNRSGAQLNDETQTAPEHTVLEGTITKVAYTVTTDGFLCPFGGTGKKESGELKGSAKLTASGEVLAKNGFALADAHAFPSPFKFTAATQSTVAGIYFTTPGTYEIWQQFLEEGTKGFALTSSSKISCPGETVVTTGEKACVYTIQATNVALGAEDVLVTKWAPKGAKFAQVIRTPVRRVK